MHNNVARLPVEEVEKLVLRNEQLVRDLDAKIAQAAVLNTENNAELRALNEPYQGIQARLDELEKQLVKLQDIVKRILAATAAELTDNVGSLLDGVQ